ncbi:MAG: PAS domain S-box protein, partial [archaeon]
MDRTDARGRLREILESSGEYEVVFVDSERELDPSIDCCIVDRKALSRHRSQLSTLRDTSSPGECPVLLVSTPDELSELVGDDLVSDFVRMPIQEDALSVRLDRALERPRRARELDRKRSEVERLAQINQLLQEVNHTLAKTDSRAEIESTVCELLAASDRYLGACIGRFDDEQGIKPTEWAWLNDAIREERPSVTGHRTDESPDGESLRSRRSRVVTDGDPTVETATDGHELASIASVPIAFRDEQYGVLTVYSADPDAFEGRLERAIEIIGETTGYAIHAVEARTELGRFREAVEGSGHSIYITATDGTIQYVNPAFEAQTGYDAGEAIGQTPAILKSGLHDKAFYTDLWGTILGGEVWESEVVNRRKDGRLYYVTQTITPITDDDGDVRFFVAINNEITDRIVREQQNQVLNRILRHNLRNQLNVISGHTELIESRAAGDDSIEQHVNTIRETVLNLLDVGQKADQSTTVLEDPIPRQPQPVCSIVQRQASTLESDHPDVSITAETPSKEISVRAKIERVVEEVLENAVEHNHRSTPRIDIAVEPLDGDRVRIAIDDDGPGIP